MKGFCVFFVLSLGMLTKTPSQQQSNREIEGTRQYCRQLLISDTAYATEQSFHLTDDIIYDKNADGYFQAMNPEGYWSDINYKSQERSTWKPSWHLYRLMLIYWAYAKNKKTAYLSAIHKGLKFWIENDFKCENWWHNNINVPFAYTALILMLDRDVLPKEMDYLNQVTVKRIPVYRATGQNLIWQLVAILSIPGFKGLIHQAARHKDVPRIE